MGGGGTAMDCPVSMVQIGIHLYSRNFDIHTSRKPAGS